MIFQFFTYETLFEDKSRKVRRIREEKKTKIEKEKKCNYLNIHNYIHSHVTLATKKKQKHKNKTKTNKHLNDYLINSFVFISFREVLHSQYFQNTSPVNYKW